MIVGNWYYRDAKRVEIVGCERDVEMRLVGPQMELFRLPVVGLCSQDQI